MASQDPWPFMPAKSTELLLMHCDDTSYVATPDTIMYKLVDAICGSTGAGALVNQIFLARAAGALETIYFSDLDYIFSKVNFLARSPAESYTYNPLVDTLTADQWNEIRTKDAWYRARVKDFFLACSLGSTSAGIRMAVQAALAVDADVFEVWRYLDNFGVTESLGRANARNELVVRPHKSALLPEEFRLVRDMIGKMVSLDTIVTIDLNGLAVHTPVPISSAAADSAYFEVQKLVTPTPLMDQLPPPELLAIDLMPTEQWMYSPHPRKAPYAAFNITQEHSSFYLVGGGRHSSIDSVTYGTINSPGSTKITIFELMGTLTHPGGSTTTVPPSSWFSALNSDLFQWIPVYFPLDIYPPQEAVGEGVVNLINAINAVKGSFIILGFGPGAIVASDVYDQIRSGSLVSRRAQFLGAAVFGNARRQSGYTFPNDPPLPLFGSGGKFPHYSKGQGIYGGDLLAHCDSSWWEFVKPGDIIADVGTDDLPSQWYTRLFQTFYTSYTGNVSAIVGAVTPPVPTGARLMQEIVDTFYGDDPSNDHGQYTSYEPLPNDYRSCSQIAFDYIGKLANVRLSAIGESVAFQPVAVYEVGGPELASATSSWLATALDSRMKYIWVPWPVSAYPLATAITTGVNNLITMINRNPGRFLLVGRGVGAIVTAQVYAQIQTGALQHRQDDYQGAVTLGSWVREEGHTFPGAPTLAGHGISTPMADTPDSWWDIADASDTMTALGTDTEATWTEQLFAAMVANYDGTLRSITSGYLDAPVNVAVVASKLTNVLYHQSGVVYDSITPLASIGDDRTAFQIALDYLHTFAALFTPYVTGPADPMDTYQPEANFESFTTSAQYGPWQTYEVADSPDNWPGGKFGIHCKSAPAINPDRTPYHFPWPSQAAYVAFKSRQVIAMGGQADSLHFRAPISAESVTKEVFLPEYAIANFPPVMDCTISQSLTRRRSRTINQSGSNQFFARTGQ